MSWAREITPSEIVKCLIHDWWEVGVRGGPVDWCISSNAGSAEVVKRELQHSSSLQKWSKEQSCEFKWLKCVSLPLRQADRLRTLDAQWELREEPLLHCVGRSQLNFLEHTTIGRRLWSKPRTCWGDQAWECLVIHHEGLFSAAEEKGVWNILLSLLCLCSHHDLEGRQMCARSLVFTQPMVKNTSSGPTWTLTYGWMRNGCSCLNQTVSEESALPN